MMSLWNGIKSILNSQSARKDLRVPDEYQNINVKE